MEQSTAKFAGETVPFLYQPLFFNADDIACFKKAVQTLMVIFNKVIDAYINRPQFRQKFGFSKLLEELILVDHRYRCNVPMARLDLFYYRPGSYKFCEFNADGSSGMNKTNVLEKIFLQSAAVADFSQNYRISYFELIDSWVEATLQNYRRFNADNPKPNVAVVDWLPAGNITEFAAFQRAYQKRGLRAEIVDPRELKYHDGKLFYQDLPIDLIYRRLVTAEMIERCELIADFIQAYRDGAVCVVGPPRSEIIHNKIIFKILHQDAADFLTPEEKAFIDKHIPYTGEFKGEQEIYLQVRQNKDHYVLKPKALYAGAGVYLGKDFTSQEWASIVQKCWNQNYLYQEYCLPGREGLVNFKNGELSLEHYNQMLGLFVYNEKFAGIYTRVGKHNVIAQNPGYYILPNFLVEKTDG